LSSNLSILPFISQSIHNYHFIPLSILGTLQGRKFNCFRINDFFPRRFLME
jgi:hypothetical protein